MNTFLRLVEGGEIDGFDELVTEEQVIGSILGGWPKGDSFADEGSRSSDGAILEADPTVHLHDAQLISRSILERLDLFLVGPRADRVAICRNLQADGFVRPTGVVDMAPVLKCVLGLVKALEVGAIQSLGIERAVETFVLAERLGMIGPGMADLYAAFDEPDGERGERATSCVAPRRAVIHRHPPGQAIAAESGLQLGFYGVASLVGTSCGNVRYFV